MIVSMDLELKDVPGQLVRALIPVSESGANIMSVIHHHEQRTPSGAIPVQVVFQLTSGRLDDIIDNLEQNDMRVVSVDKKYRLESVTLILIGHIVHSDMGDTINQIDSTGFAEVVNVSISMPGIDEPSSASLVISASGKAELTDAVNILKRVAREKDLLVIEPIETDSYR
ncbi:MAG: amino acid-binding protein [Methanosarcinales archaeon]|nr:amino acid-binding protein [ANME-2 cluster archaeon]MDW7775466.1 amino acid-binding protein [Methanosarcinales archaeon]